jgi:hypothetical protein
MVVDHGEKLLVVFGIDFRKLLGKGLPGRSELGRVARIRDADCGRRQLVCPDGKEFRLGARNACEPEADATGVDEKVELASAEGCHPLGPGDVNRGAGGIDGAGWQGRRRQSEAAAAGTAEGFLNVPGGGIVGDEVGLKDHLELGEGGGGERVYEGSCEEGNGMSDGLREVCGGGGHCARFVK